MENSIPKRSIFNKFFPYGYGQVSYLYNNARKYKKMDPLNLFPFKLAFRIAYQVNL